MDGAAARWDREAICPALIHGYTSDRFPSLESRVDGVGHFTLKREALRASCWGPIWTADLDIVAPGYRLFGVHDSGFWGSDPVVSGQFELERLRYRLEVEQFGRDVRNPRHEKGGRIWQDAVKDALALRFRAVGPPGVFVSSPPALLGRVAVTRAGRYTSDPRSAIVLAQDIATGVIHGWTDRGDPVALPWSKTAGLELIHGDRSRDPVLVTASRFYWAVAHDSVLQPLDSPHWQSAPIQVGPLQAAVAVANGHLYAWEHTDTMASYPFGVPLRGPKPRPSSRPLKQVLPGVVLPIECVATVGNTFDTLVVVAQGPDGRTSFLVPNWTMHTPTWPADRVPLPPKLAPIPVVACAGGSRVLYLALKGGGIHLLQLDTESVRPTTWKPGPLIEIDGPGGPLEFRALAVGRFELAEVLYAVAGDGTIYRFGDDGRPDQRLEVASP